MIIFQVLISVTFIVIIILKLYDWYQYFDIWKWKKNTHLKQHLQTLNQISQDINGFYLSKQGRLNNDALEYVYGEIDLISFAALISLCHPNRDSVFYDLGSGIGQTVLLSTMLFHVKKSCGIELLAPLHQAALTQSQRLCKDHRYTEKASRAMYLQGNFLDFDLNDATIIYINATAYFGDTWIALNEKLNQLTQCCTIITTTKQLIAPIYQLTHTTRVQMSWGVVHAFIYTRS